jgi:AP-1 complex subunit gamma-1
VLLCLLCCQVLVQAGAHVKEEAVRALIVLISNAEDLHGYAVRALYGAVKQHLTTAAPSLLVAGGWCIGEFGEMLPTGVCKLPCMQPKQ